MRVGQQIRLRHDWRIADTRAAIAVALQRELTGRVIAKQQDAGAGAAARRQRIAAPGASIVDRPVRRKRSALKLFGAYNCGPDW